MYSSFNQLNQLIYIDANIYLEKIEIGVLYFFFTFKHEFENGFMEFTEFRCIRIDEVAFEITT